MSPRRDSCLLLFLKQCLHLFEALKGEGREAAHLDFTLFNVHNASIVAMTSAIDHALNKFLQARSMDAQSRQSPVHAGVHARNLTPVEGNDQPETGPSGMAENMQQEEKPDLLEAQPSSAPVDRVCDLTNPLDSGGHGERSV